MDDDKLNLVRPLLTVKELEAYQKHVDSGKPKLHPDKASQFFSLYLQGYQTADIVKMNPGFDLGVVVRARVDFGWDAQKEQYGKNLMDSVRQNVEKTTLEAAQFAADGMAVFRRLAGDHFRKYLQTGDARDLGPFADMNLKHYKEFVDLFMKATGQDTSAKQRVTGEVTHYHVADGSSPQTIDSTVSHEQLLELLSSGQK